jgi:tetratricopeptide (TPR) repeat protein
MRKLIGNKYYKAKNYEKAKDFYFEAITAAEIIKDQDTTVTAMCNMSMCLLNLQNFSSALSMLNKALELQPANPLIFEKRARIYLSMNRLEQAEVDIQSGKELSQSKSTDLKFQDLSEKLNTDKKKHKEMYQKMMKTSKKQQVHLPSWISTFLKPVLSFMSIFATLKTFCNCRRKKSKKL